MTSQARLGVILLLAMFCEACGGIPPSAKESAVPDNIPEKTADSPQKEALRQTILQLTSSKFFEYTQAARKLKAMGTEIIPELYQYRNMVRESNDTIVYVCLLLIQIIFKDQPTEWVKLQLESPYPEIQKIAAEELKRRSEASKAKTPGEEKKQTN